MFKDSFFFVCESVKLHHCAKECYLNRLIFMVVRQIFGKVLNLSLEKFLAPISSNFDATLQACLVKRFM